ncbi:MAG TPA: hypothetical protein VIZ19_08765 [Roseiarcus sp.]|jgi:hypothetical protein
MRVSIRKTVVAAVAALGMATAVATISTPAEAQWHGGGGGFHGGGFHGGGFGGGGFRGGGWGGGGWHGGGWRGGGWGRPGWGGGGWGWRRAGWGGGWNGGWGGGCWNCGWGWGGGWGWDPGWAIAAATVPIGVAIASQPAYGGPGCWVRRRVWTANGHYMGRRLVNVCD